MADDDPQMQPMQGWELKETAERYTHFFCHLFFPSVNQYAMYSYISQCFSQQSNVDIFFGDCSLLSNHF